MELMIAVSIIGILASIAIPSYRQYLIRSQRSEAKIALLQLQTAQEKFYMQNNAFADAANVTTASPAGLGMSGVTETGKYDIRITAYGAGGQSFTATASPRAGGGPVDDAACANFTITDRGTRGVSGSLGAQACWR